MQTDAQQLLAIHAQTQALSADLHTESPFDIHLVFPAFFFDQFLQNREDVYKRQL